jgi:hypothetical protein
MYSLRMLIGAPPQDAAKYEGDHKTPFQYRRRRSGRCCRSIRACIPCTGPAGSWRARWHSLFPIYGANRTQKQINWRRRLFGLANASPGGRAGDPPRPHTLLNGRPGSARCVRDRHRDRDAREGPRKRLIAITFSAPLLKMTKTCTEQASHRTAGIAVCATVHSLRESRFS